MPLLKKSKKGDGSTTYSNPNLAGWTREPDGSDMDLQGHTDTALSASFPTGPHVHFPRGAGPLGERLQPLTRGEDTAFVLRQAAQAQSPNMHKRVQMMTGGWERQAPYTPPMGHKRKKDKKEKKEKKGKGDKKSDLKISAPLNVRHVGMPNVVHLATPLSETTNFPVEHLATMPVEGQMTHISPFESIRKVRNLIQRGEMWTQEIILAVTSEEIIIKDGTTRHSLNVIPLHTVTSCKSLQDQSDNVLMVCSQDHVSHRPKMHFFQCAMTPAEAISNEIQLAMKRHRQVQEEEARRKRRGGFKGSSQSIGENWILQEPTPLPPPPSELPPAIPLPPRPTSPTPDRPPPPGRPPPPSEQLFHTPVPGMHFTDGVAGPQTSNSPAPGDVGERRLSHSATDSQLYQSAAASNRAESTHTLEAKDDSSVGSGGTPLQRQKRVGDFVSRASNKYISNVHAKPGRVDTEIKRTMKASRIQRDVDILNHVFDDLEAFMMLLKQKAAAWSELERKMKKSKRKKHDAAVEALRKKAAPPTEEEFSVSFQKCKFGINLIAKLGHHLSSPSPAELLKGIFGYIQEFIQLNKSPKLAASVVSPLFTKKATDFMTRKLSGKEALVWTQLGGNWLIAVEQWPAQPLPPDYEIEFSDGCIPPNLHNASDCPANFPTLDTLPREQRHPDYSDVYDGDQPETETGGLMINPAVAAVVASKAAAVTSPILPGVVVNGVRKLSVGDTGLQRYGPTHTSQLSLNSVGSQTETTKMAKAIFDYQAAALEELSIHRGEKVEVLDDSKNWWMVKNRLGSTGYLPCSLLEVVPPKKRSASRGDLRDENMINFHGRSVPAPPKTAPPPLPSPKSSRRPSTSKHSPQVQLQGRKVSQQPQMSTLMEVSESRSSTISRPPGLAPPPSFAPAPPPQYRSAAPPPPPFPGAPLPPPPPPIQAPTPMVSISDMISQHKLKTAQSGKSQKKKLYEQDRPFDITGALKSRKPLRKTSTATALEVGHSSSSHELAGKLQGRKLSNVTEIEETDGYRVLPWKAEKTEIKRWLLEQGYTSCADKLNYYSGHQLYHMDRDELKDLCGASDGVRLYSQLQSDKKQAQREGGAARESQFQKLMRERKSKADQSGDAEPTLLKGWGRNRGMEEGGHLRDKETILDGSSPKRPPPHRRQPEPPVLKRFGGTPYRDERELTPPRQEFGSRRGRNYEEERGGYEEERGGYDGRSLGRRRDYRDERGDRRGRKYSENRYEDESIDRRRNGTRTPDRYREEERGRGRYDDKSFDRRRNSTRSRRSSRSGAYSDDEGLHQKERDREWGRHRYDSDGGRKSRTKKHRPTDIDSFDDDDDLSDSESESYSSDSDESGRGRMRSSASVSELTNAKWTLGDDEDLDDRIKMQQGQIKKLLESLAEVQKRFGVKSLPAPQQKILQQDLQKLEQLQTRRKENPNALSLQMQLIGQQMLLCEHLRKASIAVTQGAQVTTPSRLVQSQSSQSLKLQMLQQQQQALAEQQRQIILEHHMQMEAEQQQQMLIAAEAQRQMILAEQQRQMHLAQQQMQAQLAQQQQLQAVGMVGMQVYNPYTAAVGYF